MSENPTVSLHVTLDQMALIHKGLRRLRDSALATLSARLSTDEERAEAEAELALLEELIGA